MSWARYTYAVGRSFDRAVISGLRGVDGAEVDLVRHRDLVAVISPVERAETDAALRDRLERLDELAVIAQAHHAVVTAVAAHTVVAPFRLATIYQDTRRVTEVLDHRYAEFKALLDRLAGSVEVGVKLYVDDRPHVPAASGGSGRAYLQQLSQRHRRRDEAWRNAAAGVERINAALGAHAVDRSDHRPQTAALSGVAGHNILNAAYLVPTDRVAEFAELAHRATEAEPALRVEVTGPWAPYSFTDRVEPS